MLAVHVLKGPSLFEHLRESWQDLASSDPAATPFQTWEWQSTWFKHYGSGKAPWAVCIYEGGDLVGLMTLVRTGGPWRCLRSLGVGPSDYLHPLIRSPEVMPWISGFIESISGVDLIDLHQIRETYSASKLGANAAEQARCLVLDLPDSYDKFVDGLGKSLRYDVRKLDRSLIQSRKAVVERVSQDRLDQSFDAFLEQHRMRWRSRRLPGAFVGRATRFHREWVQTAHRRGWLRLRLLRVEGRIIGAIYAMAYGDTVYYYQAGFDPEMRSYSPGNLLVAQAVHESIDEGKTRFDFMRGDEPYKRRWKPQHSWANMRVMIPGASLRGAAAFGWNDAMAGLEGKVRAKLESAGTGQDKR